MNFWIRNIIFAIILIALAGYFFIGADTFFPSDEKMAEQQSEQTVEKTDAEPVEVTPTTTKKPAQKKEKSTNAAADGLSRFYASINPDMNEGGPKIRNNIVYLPKPEGSLKQILEARRLVTRPYKKNWQGEVESRPFRTGETLFQKLSEYSKASGVEVIWWLEYDFVVKDSFRINKNILDTARQVGKAVEGHFINGISSYFCYQHRAIVLIEEPIDYLNNECTLLRSKNNY